MDADSVVASVARGKTFYDGNTVDTADYGGIHIEGSIRRFKDYDYVADTTMLKLRSAAMNTCVLVRNVSGINLLPGRAARWQAAMRGRRVDGYTTTLAAEAAGIVDEWLPPAGVPNGDLFWLLIDGNTLLRTDLAGDTGTDFSEGDILIAATAATSQATTAGRLRQADFDTAITGLLLGNQIANRIGRAMSANTTAQTNRQLLAQVSINRV